LRTDLITPSIAAETVTEEEAAFEAIFRTDASYSSVDLPYLGGRGGTKTYGMSATPSVSVPLKTGGDVTVSAPLVRADGTVPSYAADAETKIEQPLLRGAGLRANTHAIRVARLEKQGSEATAKLEVIAVLASVDRLYWRLYAASRELEVRRQEHELAKAQLARAKRQVEAGTKPEVEIIRAQLGVAESVESIIVAANDERDRQRDLKRALQKPGLDMDTPTTIVPADEPEVRRYSLDVERLAELALGNRMELFRLQLQIAQDSSSVQLARNDTLPLASLAYTYNVNGLGPTPGDAYDLMFDKRYEDHTLGLQVEIPLGNQAARGRLRKAMLTRLQRLAEKKDQESLIRQEVYNTADQLEANWHRIQASRQRVVHARRVMDAERRQFDQGLRTSTEVLEAQTSLADAQLAEIDAIAEYQIAQVDIAVATGTLLGADRIRWEPVSMDTE
jgi:outer membrane protein TolC